MDGDQGASRQLLHVAVYVHEGVTFTAETGAPVDLVQPNARNMPKDLRQH